MNYGLLALGIFILILSILLYDLLKLFKNTKKLERKLKSTNPDDFNFGTSLSLDEDKNTIITVTKTLKYSNYL